MFLLAAGKVGDPDFLGAGLVRLIGDPLAVGENVRIVPEVRAEERPPVVFPHGQYISFLLAVPALSESAPKILPSGDTSKVRWLFEESSPRARRSHRQLPWRRSVHFGWSTRSRSVYCQETTPEPCCARFRARRAWRHHAPRRSPDREISAERSMIDGRDACVVRRQLNAREIAYGSECAESLASTIEPRELRLFGRVCRDTSVPVADTVKRPTSSEMATASPDNSPRLVSNDCAHSVSAFGYRR